MSAQYAPFCPFVTEDERLEFFRWITGVEAIQDGSSQEEAEQFVETYCTLERMRELPDDYFSC